MPIEPRHAPRVPAARTATRDGASSPSIPGARHGTRAPTPSSHVPMANGARLLRAAADGERRARHRDAPRRARRGAGAGAVPADERHRRRAAGSCCATRSTSSCRWRPSGGARAVRLEDRQRRQEDACSRSPAKPRSAWRASARAATSRSSARSRCSTGCPHRLLGRMMRTTLLPDLRPRPRSVALRSREGRVRHRDGDATSGVFGISAALRTAGAVQPDADGGPDGRRSRTASWPRTVVPS